MTEPSFYSIGNLKANKEPIRSSFVVLNKLGISVLCFVRSCSKKGGSFYYQSCRLKQTQLILIG